MGVFTIKNNKEITLNRDSGYTGPTDTVVFIDTEKDVEYLRGVSANLIICNFAETKEIHNILKPCIMDGIAYTGIIRYLKKRELGVEY